MSLVSNQRHVPKEVLVYLQAGLHPRHGKGGGSHCSLCGQAVGVKARLNCHPDQKTLTLLSKDLSHPRVIRAARDL